MCGYNAFLSQKQQQDKTLITKKKKKKWLLYLAHRIQNVLQNGPKNFCRPKPPLHGLSPSNSPIIWVRSGHQPDQIMPDDDISWNKIHPLSSL